MTLHDSSTRYTRARRPPALLVAAAAAAAIALGAETASAQQATARPAVARLASMPAPTGPLTFDSTVFTALKWREIGPARGGRSVAVGGSVQRPMEYWMGTTGGGVFKTTDAGITWTPMSDKFFGGTIGAIAVDPTNADVVYVGGGETDIRGNTSHGDGLWKTTDGGKTWSFLGFKDEHISTIRVHPTNAQTLFLGVLGKVFASNPERGVFKSTDGGKTFAKTLFVNDSTGAIDIAMDPSNPDVLYAAMWQAYRTPWSMSSGGPGSGLYKSTNGGTTWTNIGVTAQGFPKGIIGKMGLTISPAKPSRVWAIVEHDSGGVYRSDDAGQTWSYINKDRKLRQRAWYYSQIYADPKDTNVIYGLNVGFFRSRDGGKTFPQSISVPHSDNHDMWIAPDNGDRMVQANDGGANVTFNGGRSWSDQDFPTAQFYHISTTNDFPYYICGAQQDNSTLCGPSRKPGGVGMRDWYDAGGGESGYIAAHPLKPGVTFAGSYGGLLTRRDRLTEFERNITVYPINPMGHSSIDIKERFQWTYPIVFSRHNSNVLYAAGSRLWRSTNEGESWTPVSPDLSRHDPKTMQASGGPITKDQTGVETYALIFTFDESPVTPGLLWVGTDDGLVQLSRNNGVSWENVTPKDMGDFTRVSIIEPSRYAAGTAYVAANRYQQGDNSPILFKTTDYGKSWTRIVDGIAPTHFTRVIREDPVRRGLLFAGTERGVYVSFDDGRNWAILNRNLPIVPIHDLQVKDNDVIVATHGRSFWVLDDISALRQVTPAIAAKPAHLFKPVDAYRVNWGGGFLGGGEAGTVGANPPSGAVVYFHLKAPNQKVELDFLDAQGKVIQSLTSDQDPATAADSVRQAQARANRVDSLTRTGISKDSAEKVLAAAAVEGGGGFDFEAFFTAGPRPQRVPNKAGVNMFNWNLRYPDAVRFQSMIMWAGSVNGPTAPAGTYSVRLRTGGETQTQTFRVRKDPRSTATDADLMEQFNLLVAVRDKVSEANNAVRTVRNVRWQVGDRTAKITGADAADLKNLTGELMTKITANEEEVYQTRNQSSQDPLNYPIKLNNKIAALTGVINSGEYRPTKQSKEAFAVLSDSLNVQLRAMKGTMDDLLPRINAILKKNGLQEIVPSTEEIRDSRPAVAMDDDDGATMDDKKKW